MKPEIRENNNAFELWLVDEKDEVLLNVFGSKPDAELTAAKIKKMIRRVKN